MCLRPFLTLDEPRVRTSLFDAMANTLCRHASRRIVVRGQFISFSSEAPLPALSGKHLSRSDIESPRRSKRLSAGGCWIGSWISGKRFTQDIGFVWGMHRALLLVVSRPALLGCSTMFHVTPPLQHPPSTRLVGPQPADEKPPRSTRLPVPRLEALCTVRAFHEAPPQSCPRSHLPAQASDRVDALRGLLGQPEDTPQGPVAPMCRSSTIARDRIPSVRVNWSDAGRYECGPEQGEVHAAEEPPSPECAFRIRAPSMSRSCRHH